MVKSRTSTLPCSIFYFSGKNLYSCNKLHRVSQLFFFQDCRLNVIMMINLTVYAYSFFASTTPFPTKNRQFPTGAWI